MERLVTTTTCCCPCCGGKSFADHKVLWPQLIEAWELSADESAYIDRQQGTRCRGCGSNLRSMALARAILRAYHFDGTLQEWVAGSQARSLSILELNGAGTLSPFFRMLPGHHEASYPDVDMLSMPFPCATFDLVVHSDTLEHVPDPLAGLSECRRVIKGEGSCCFTVPIVVGRPTRSRRGKPPSYHGAPGCVLPDYLVHTEYGADAWIQAVEAGFTEVRIVAQEYPAALAFVAIP